MWSLVESRDARGDGERRASDTEPSHADFLNVLAALRRFRDKVLGIRRTDWQLLETSLACPAALRRARTTPEILGRSAECFPFVFTVCLAASTLMHTPGYSIVMVYLKPYFPDAAFLRHPPSVV